MTAQRQHPAGPVPELEGVGKGAEYAIAEGDEHHDGTLTGSDHPDRRSVRGNPATDESDVEQGVEKLSEISGN
jgi:hypothetical protein